MLQADTNGPPVQGFTGLSVGTVGAEALVLSVLETGPILARLEPLVVDGSDIIIRGNSLGGVIQSGPTVQGPWTTVPVETGEVRVSVTNAPARFFRVRGN